MRKLKFLKLKHDLNIIINSNPIRCGTYFHPLLSFCSTRTQSTKLGVITKFRWWAIHCFVLVQQKLGEQAAAAAAAREDVKWGWNPCQSIRWWWWTDGRTRTWPGKRASYPTETSHHHGIYRNEARTCCVLSWVPWNVHSNCLANK